jgi:hypothetical protein
MIWLIGDKGMLGSELAMDQLTRLSLSFILNNDRNREVGAIRRLA